ncbi:redox-sensing transcriptional repressor Rex [Bacillus massiliglaciei]|uniref:redox-sensing transcriptional repressor Rex n=1 Tax=Bacillus massiliglaciei TaxID=1816693 RepID=UPI000A5483BD|nr:redox-sensing transcriptional repressor Rex [Bacillus massiliglaciei]
MHEQMKIPQATAKRLPLYYRFIKNLHSSGKQRVSSAELSEAVKVDSATIRRDFSYFGALGKKGYGYNVNYLLSFFRKTLDQDELTKVALIGVGNLGTAFLNYNFIKNNNTKIEMAFEVDEAKVGTKIADVPIYHMEEIETKIRENGITVAILTVPAQVAQSITDRLVKADIKGILNFTPARLTVPAQIRIHHIDLAVELQSLIYFLKHYPIVAEEEKLVKD